MAKDAETAQEKANRMLAELLEKTGKTQDEIEAQDPDSWHGR
jgi:hypothetical protein